MEGHWTSTWHNHCRGFAVQAILMIDAIATFMFLSAFRSGDDD